MISCFLRLIVRWIYFQILHLIKTVSSALQAYDLMRRGACLPDPTTNSYCYMSAVMNTNPSDLYFYSLPDGLFLPNTTTPTCSACTKSIMTLYAQALSDQYPDGASRDVDETAPLVDLLKTYGASAVLTQNHCGAAYASTVAASTVAGAAHSLGTTHLYLTSTLTVVVSVVFGLFVGS